MPGRINWEERLWLPASFLWFEMKLRDGYGSFGPRSVPYDKKKQNSYYRHYGVLDVQKLTLSPGCNHNSNSIDENYDSIEYCSFTASTAALRLQK